MAKAISGANVTTATSTDEGVVELATDAETVTGTDTGRAVTPAGVAAAIAGISGGGGIAPTIFDAKGDLIVATAADTAARLAVSGSDGYILTVNSGESTGLQWAAPPAGASSATSTSEGVVELATEAEVITGTDTARAVTPAGVSAAIAEFVPSSSSFVQSTIFDA